MYFLDSFLACQITSCASLVLFEYLIVDSSPRLALSSQEPPNTQRCELCATRNTLCSSGHCAAAPSPRPAATTTALRKMSEMPWTCLRSAFMWKCGRDCAARTDVTLQIRCAFQSVYQIVFPAFFSSKNDTFHSWSSHICVHVLRLSDRSLHSQYFVPSLVRVDALFMVS